MLSLKITTSDVAAPGFSLGADAVANVGSDVMGLPVKGFACGVGGLGAGMDSGFEDLDAGELDQLLEQQLQLQNVLNDEMNKIEEEKRVEEARQRYEQEERKATEDTASNGSGVSDEGKKKRRRGGRRGRRRRKNKAGESGDDTASLASDSSLEGPTGPTGSSLKNNTAKSTVTKSTKVAKSDTIAPKQDIPNLLAAGVSEVNYDDEQTCNIKVGQLRTLLQQSNAALVRNLVQEMGDYAPGTVGVESFVARYQGWERLVLASDTVQQSLT